MSIVGAKFRFFVTPNGGPQRQVYPVTDELSIKWKKEADNWAFSKTFETELCFINKPSTGLDDFDYFLNIENSGDFCEEIEIVVEILCSTVWTPVFNGVFATGNGDFDLDRCQFRVTPSPNEIYDCFVKRYKDDRFNFLTTPEVTVTDYTTTPVEQTCNDIFFGVPVVPRPGPQSGCLANPADGWTLKFYDASFTPTGGGLGDWQITTTWIREEITLPCAGGVGGTPSAPCGSNWVLISDDCAGLGTATYARPPKMRLVSILQNPPDITITYVRIILSDIYDNGHLLNDVLETFVPANCGITGVSSDLFGLNPLGGTPANDIYNIWAPELADLVLYQRSDVLFPAASNAATITDVTYFEILDALRSMFNLAWTFEGTVLRIEHISYFTSGAGPGLDLTTAPFNLWAAGTNKYNYPSLEVPRQESLLMPEALGQDFIGVPIIYDSPCVTDPENEKVFSSGEIMTDFDNALDNPNSIEPTGFFLMAACFDGTNYYLNQTTGAISGQTVANGLLAAANLMDVFWPYERELIEGRLNGADVVFNSAKPRKTQEIPALVCCADLINFDPSDLITTGLGVLRLDEATYDAKKDCIEFTLKF